MDAYRMLIDGKLVGAESGRTFPNVNPATEEVIGDTADGGATDLDAAVAAARRAFDDTAWSTDAAFRRRGLEQLHAGLLAASDELRAVVVAEGGSPVALTYAFQLDGPVSDIPYWAATATDYEYEQPMPEREVYGMAARRIVRREAAGVVGAITPWNFPVYLNLAKVVPALAAGCTIVLKPAPDTPWSACVLARVIAEATDIPPGVVNVVTSSDHLVGEQLVCDPRVDMVTFTGSTATGRRIMANAAKDVRRVFLELGGKSASILLDDADLEAVIPGEAFGMCIHSGQGCAINSRMLVPRARYDDAISLAVDAFGAIPYGDPLDPQNVMGPQINEAQRSKVLGMVEHARADGARVALGGGVPSHLPKGFYVEPTVVVGLGPDSRLAQDEVFGPVVVILPYDDVDDAVRIANHSIYGLSGAVYGADEERALAVARRIRTGSMAVNGGMFAACDMPYGGYRQSGIGREGGRQGFEEYLETKAIGLPA